MTDAELDQKVNEFIENKLSQPLRLSYIDFFIALSDFYIKNGVLKYKDTKQVRDARDNFFRSKQEFENKMKQKILSDLKE